MAEPTIAVRFEGGLGDHILAMRLLPFIYRRYPECQLIVYSDCGGEPTQLEVLKLSPHPMDIVSVFKDPLRITADDWWSLNNLESKWLEAMRSADLFIDACGKLLFIPIAKDLAVSPYEILASRPEIRVPQAAHGRAQSLIGSIEERKLVGINLTKYGAGFLRSNHSTLQEITTVRLKYFRCA